MWIIRNCANLHVACGDGGNKTMSAYFWGENKIDHKLVSHHSMRWIEKTKQWHFIASITMLFISFTTYRIHRLLLNIMLSNSVDIVSWHVSQGRGCHPVTFIHLNHESRNTSSSTNIHYKIILYFTLSEKRSSNSSFIVVLHFLD